MSTTEPIHRRPEGDTCGIYLGISKPESRYGGRWVLTLEWSIPELTTTTYSAYYAVGSPFRENPYAHEQINDGACAETQETFSEFYLLAMLQGERIQTFLDAFFETRAGPSKYFILRVVFGLWERGIVESAVVDVLLGMVDEMGYEGGEAEYYYYNLAAVDYFFLREDVRGSGFRVGRGVDDDDDLRGEFGHGRSERNEENQDDELEEDIDELDVAADRLALSTLGLPKAPSQRSTSSGFAEGLPM
ncbi:uncharacterized protein DSM5745_08510 [Aspergillus mulundensis]|uniref:Uncharacterized protein n=1 Tax=Aspergillus mulundensis TaxID=1810919 RepID=A0A3D8R457_9EURO|nr:Uncharacterized protein DSM5745_08510 [Aspergillus mulundensis]RDW68750.1 Uncharacterized protein DSM5745_08510 [Aspergillus mulundensis]